jgi:NADPH:quinone reductase-like Zn-dependent oxidoreductase
VTDTLKLVRVNLFSGGKKAEFYGITALYLRNKKPFMEDLPKMFCMLEEGKIKPVITEKYSLLEAKHANELLESGQVIGNIVLVSPELL